MKKLLLFTFIVFFSNLSFGQLANGDFESWTTVSWDDLDTATRTANGEVVAAGYSANVTKSTDKQHGNYSIKLENIAMGDDTAFGYFIFGDIQDDPISGIPFTQKPDSLHGYYKSGLLAGDTGLVLAVFWQNDTVRSMDMYQITGTQSTWTKFSMALNISTSTVDSVTFAAVSANPFNGLPAQPGSWMQLDNIWFSGTGVTQNIPNHSFEHWTTISVENPDSWVNWNTEMKAYINTVHVEKATPAYKGNYAAKLTSIYIPADSSTIGAISNGDFDDDDLGGAPFTNQVDTLCGWYKYTPSGSDTAFVNISFSKNDTIFDWAGTQLMSAASYTYFEVPFNLSMAPDTVQIFISSSSYNIGGSGAGSVLIIDELQFKSAPLTTGISSFTAKGFGTKAYPNPARDYVKIEYEIFENVNDVAFEIYDISGKQVFRSVYGSPAFGKNVILLNTSTFASGIYSYKLISGKHSLPYIGKFSVE